MMPAVLRSIRYARGNRPCLAAFRVCAAILIVSCGWPAIALSQFGDGVSVRNPAEAFPPTDQPSSLLAESGSAEERFWQEEHAAQITEPPSKPVTETTASQLGEMLSPEELTPTLRTVLLIGVLSLVPAVLVMSTCFARFAIVFGLLRQGLGAQQWLPNQIVLALSLFLTVFVMAPVWKESYESGIRPYADGSYATSSEQRIALEVAFTNSAEPVRQFMGTQIAATGNEAAIDMLLSYQQPSGTVANVPQYYEDVPLSVLLPAYLLSELKTAFVIGFQIVLPFLVIDLVVASVLAGMGLMMLPPVLVSLPFKLLLFVLIDGWTLTVEMLLSSVPAG